MKKLFTILISLLSITAYAQNEQRSGTFDAGLSFGVSGDYVYHCTYNDIGEKILNGPFTMNGDLTAHLQSSVFKLSKDLIDSIHEEGIVAYTS